ncbi:uncharacterized protein LOC125230338 [Leguminivora glycinivorella]|uniref:uncharacterized protein LOC125230338 n=1 Tax=Leguminivora glycinivorella TaxID=1035111 RepID=UPI00200E33E2|nr:uncharacterized protein LOC125230338 [Leguminivora glycinivorella]
MKLLRLAPIPLAFAMSELFNRCIEEGVMPSLLKTSKVAPIFKGKGKRADIDGYRPISIIPAASKVLESGLSSRLSNFLVDTSALSERQYAYRPGHSTTSLTRELIRRIMVAKESQLQVAIVCCDLSKAFDVADHALLEAKLQHYGISGSSLALFTSLLKERSQITVSDGAKVPKTLAAFPRWTAIDNLCTRNDPERGSSPLSLRRLPSSKKKARASEHQHPVVSTASGTNKYARGRDSYKRMEIYDDIGSSLLMYLESQVKTTSSSIWSLLLYLESQVKTTRSSMWRQLSVSYELVRAREKLSRAHSDLQHLSHSDQHLSHSDLVEDASVRVASNLATGVEHLNALVQYLKADRLEIEEVQAVIDYYKTTFFINGTVKIPDIKSNDGPNYAKDWKTCLDKLRRFQYGFRSVIRTSVQHEVWTARRTLGVGVGIFVALLIATPVLILLLRNTITTMQGFSTSIVTTTQRLMAEKQKSDLLLSKMLPMPVLQRLRAQKTVPAEAFDAVTIFFSDIVGFTAISANSTPMEIINMLNMLYRLFDEKITQYNVYKVETIGDAYMAVSGLPQRNGNKHASEIADMSLSLMRSLDGATVPHCPDSALKIRAGVNTGPCVAGVVGTCMPRYCLFGDTINTASRMESTGEAMKIHISDTTKRALDDIGGYEVESRGITEIPGKGQMETFWLVGKLAGLQLESPSGPRLKDYDQEFIEMLIS